MVKTLFENEHFQENKNAVKYIGIDLLNQLFVEECPVEIDRTKIPKKISLE